MKKITAALASDPLAGILIADTLIVSVVSVSPVVKGLFVVPLFLPWIEDDADEEVLNESCWKTIPTMRNTAARIIIITRPHDVVFFIGTSAKCHNMYINYCLIGARGELS